MASEKGTKINRLLKQWPSGTVAVLRWLEKQGVYQQLVHEYEKSAWIRRIGQGAYAKSGDKIDWSGGLFALQNQLGLHIYAAARQLSNYRATLIFSHWGKAVRFFFSGRPILNCLPGLRNTTGISISVLLQHVFFRGKRTPG